MQEMIEKLKEKKMLIDPERLDEYTNNFKNYEEEMTKNLANPKFWGDKRVLVTGISGFVGSYLVEKLIEYNCDIAGLVRRHSVPEYKNITHILKNVKLVEGNLTDINSLFTLIKQFEPEVIFHLGAQSFVPTSFRCPIETYETNIMGTANLLEAARATDADIHTIHVAGSSEEYGKVYPDEVPITEKNPLRPQSPYALSKVAVDMMCRSHFECYGVPVVTTRAFNHTGARRGLQFVTSVITRQIAKILANKVDKVIIGNPDPIRDFTDVRDMVQGYLLSVEKGKKGEVYNLGHGFGISIKDLVKLALKVSNLNNVEIEIDKSRFRPAEVDVLICDYSKSKDELGYKPRIPLTKAVIGNIEYFRENEHLLDIEMH
ncbi:MAG: GDP-mannose 4,6-dehydratase [Thermotogota bacterium]|nr:GDP-mannose 4,6-dehydratase [Thermotogota bacterium]